MQSQDLQQFKEVQPTTNIQLRNQTEFTVKPTGELQVKGSLDPEIVRQLLTSSDYHKDQSRKMEATIKNQQSSIDMMIVGFLGATFLIAIFCLFLTVNQRQNNQGNNNNGELIRRTYCQ